MQIKALPFEPLIPNAETIEAMKAAQRHLDHPLSGEWSDHRDCHIKPDLILIYRKPDDDHLDLVRLGSHSELGLQSRFCLNRVSPTAAGHAHEVAGLPFSHQYRPLEVSLYTAAPLLAIWGRVEGKAASPARPGRI